MNKDQDNENTNKNSRTNNSRNTGLTEKGIRDTLQSIAECFPPFVLIILLAICYVIEIYVAAPIVRTIIRTLVENGLGGMISVDTFLSAVIITCLSIVHSALLRAIVSQEIPYRIFRGKAAKISRIFERISKALTILGDVLATILGIINLMEYGWGWIILDGIEDLVIWFIYAHICSFFVLLFADKERLRQYREDFRKEDEEGSI